VGLLYAYDLGNRDISKFTEEILEEKKIRHRQRAFSLKLFDGTMRNLMEIDKEIKKHLQSWNYDSLGKVEKAILRLATYEILFDKIERAIIINEAVELAKEFADEKSPKFVNGVLDSIGK